jgi:SAM-dependent methyltransferase
VRRWLQLVARIVGFPLRLVVVFCRLFRHADCHPGTKDSLSVRPSYFNDARVSAFLTRSEWFEGKTVLDVGCNAGYIALATAQLLKPRSVEGLDIDPKLIHKARQLLSDRVACLAAKTPANSHEGLRFPISCGMPAQPPTLPTVDARNILPFNVSFRCEDVCANAATNSVIVHQQYDVIVW